MFTDMHLPILPLQFVPGDLEADTFRLNNVQRFDVVSQFKILLRLCQ